MNREGFIISLRLDFGAGLFQNFLNMNQNQLSNKGGLISWVRKNESAMFTREFVHECFEQEYEIAKEYAEQFPKKTIFSNIASIITNRSSPKREDVLLHRFNQLLLPYEIGIERNKGDTYTVFDWRHLYYIRL